MKKRIRTCSKCKKQKRTSNKIKTFVCASCSKPPKKLIQPKFLAVVIGGNDAVRSNRPMGDWSCFVDVTKEAAAQRALDAAAKWYNPDNGRGPYHVVVGELTESVRVPVRFELVAL
jgi:hypothetical protein